MQCSLLISECNHHFLQETMVGKCDASDLGQNENFAVSVSGGKKHFRGPCNKESQ